MAKAQKISKVKLSNGQIYSFFDSGAIHYDEKLDTLLVGVAVIDDLIINNGLTIEQIDDIDAEEFITSNLLVEKGGVIKKHSASNLLEDIGGCSYKMDTTKGILSLKIGKQNNN